MCRFVQMFVFYLSACQNTWTQYCLINRRIGRHSPMNQCQLILTQSASVHMFRNIQMSNIQKHLNTYYCFLVCVCVCVFSNSFCTFCSVPWTVCYRKKGNSRMARTCDLSEGIPRNKHIHVNFKIL